MSVDSKSSITDYMNAFYSTSTAGATTTSTGTTTSPDENSTTDDKVAAHNPNTCTDLSCVDHKYAKPEEKTGQIDSNSHNPSLCDRIDCQDHAAPKENSFWRFFMGAQYCQPVGYLGGDSIEADERSSPQQQVDSNSTFLTFEVPAEEFNS